MRFVAFVRAINVGGHQPIKMAELRDRFYDAGATNVATYIQSGNVVFAHEAKDPAPLIAAATGFAVIVRTARQLANLVEANPFPKEPTKHLHVLFLAAKTKVTVAAAPPERYVQRGNDVFVCLPNGAGRSKLAASLGKLGGTLRNWRTVETLVAMSRA
jgi:uncharacterized protein (DUF1697 family)